MKIIDRFPSRFFKAYILMAQENILKREMKHVDTDERNQNNNLAIHWYQMFTFLAIVDMN